ncbi:MAG: 50S ribosomal protein L29 [Salinivirgaceae bacterium]|jgi:large subunit ribosomal protein L29|nr:50S ribosomal protein L29 [Salinivirgaceae bacterium]
MKASEVRELSTLEIQEQIENNTKALTKMRLNHAVSPLDNPNKIGETKRDIARLKTELRAREINQNK